MAEIRCPSISSQYDCTCQVSTSISSTLRLVIVMAGKLAGSILYYSWLYWYNSECTRDRKLKLSMPKNMLGRQTATIWVGGRLRYCEIHLTCKKIDLTCQRLCWRITYSWNYHFSLAKALCWGHALLFISFDRNKYTPSPSNQAS